MLHSQALHPGTSSLGGSPADEGQFGESRALSEPPVVMWPFREAQCSPGEPVGWTGAVKRTCLQCAVLLDGLLCLSGPPFPESRSLV